MKIFLERMYSTGDIHELRVTDSNLMFHHITREICSKPFVSLVCCDNLEALTPANVRQYFNTFSRFMDAPHVGELVRNGGGLVGYGNNTEMLNRLQAAEKIYDAYVQAGEELAAVGYIRSRTQRKANREIISIPFFGLIKRINSGRIKKQFIKHAMQSTSFSGLKTDH